jgi:hypothetical protein
VGVVCAHEVRGHEAQRPARVATVRVESEIPLQPPRRRGIGNLLALLAPGARRLGPTLAFAGIEVHRLCPVIVQDKFHHLLLMAWVGPLRAAGVPYGSPRRKTFVGLFLGVWGRLQDPRRIRPPAACLHFLAAW